MKNLSQPLHGAGQKLTVDITVYNAGSPTWSLCYDREKLSEFCDYEIIMGYDETPRTSPYAGSVSSYSWLDRSIEKLTAMVPPEKLILGLPFYTRIYEGNPGHMKSKVLAMKGQEALMNKYRLKPIWQPDAKQYTLTWRQGGILHRTYLEEEKSLKAKLELEKNYNLAGLAFWRYGFEKPGIFGELERKDDRN
jgi:spore germination protein YaaH